MKLDRAAEWIARMLALLGGASLIAIIAITVISITGRALVFAGLGPVAGDYELVEASASFAVFAFLPWCQLNRGHASVEVVTRFFPAVVNQIIDLVAEILMATVIIIIAWKMWGGTFAKLRYGETTFILQFPLWWAYAASLFAALIACGIALYMVLVRLRELIARNIDYNSDSGAVH